MISWLKSLLTTVKKPAKIVKIWRVDPNNMNTTDELYEYLTGKKENKNSKEHERIHNNKTSSTMGRSEQGTKSS